MKNFFFSLISSLFQRKPTFSQRMARYTGVGFKTGLPKSELTRPEKLKAKNPKWWNIGLVVFLFLCLLGVANADGIEKGVERAKEIAKEYMRVGEANIEKRQEEWRKEESKKKEVEARMNELHHQAEAERGKIRGHAEKNDLSLSDVLGDCEKTMRGGKECKKSCGKVQKVGWSYEASFWIQYAYDLSDCDKEFIVMMEAENGGWDHKSQSRAIDKNTGKPEDSWGFCQTHRKYHPEIVNDPRFFTDQAWQLQNCLTLWRGGTKFYGYRNEGQREVARSHLIFE